MNTHAFTLNGAEMVARATGTLWWPERRLLCVSDLHLGKSERMARRGGAMLPPYEIRDTLDRLAAEITALDPDTVVALGDSFDDSRAVAALRPEDHEALSRMVAGRDWIWIAGNHDPSGLDGLQRAELNLGPLTFRHIAQPDASGELSGHYHPKARLGAARRACFVIDSHRAVLPAFGTYTGGLDCLHPDLRGLFGDDARAVLTGPRCLAVPLGPQVRQRA